MTLGGGSFHGNQNVIALQRYRKGIDRYPGIVAPGPVSHIESPGVQRAGNHTALQLAGTEAGTHMRAGIIDGVEATIDAENGDDPLVDFKRTPFAFRNVLAVCYPVQFRHTDQEMRFPRKIC